MPTSLGNASKSIVLARGAAIDVVDDGNGVANAVDAGDRRAQIEAGTIARHLSASAVVDAGAAQSIRFGPLML